MVIDPGENSDTEHTLPPCEGDGCQKLRLRIRGTPGQQLRYEARNTDTERSIWGRIWWADMLGGTNISNEFTVQPEETVSENGPPSQLGVHKYIAAFTS